MLYATERYGIYVGAAPSRETLFETKDLAFYEIALESGITALIWPRAI
jgi:hypothetical protein